MKKKWRVAAGVLLGAAGILTAGYLFWCTTLEDRVIWETVSVNGVPLAGKTKEEAREAVEQQFAKEYGNKEVTIFLAEREYRLEIFPALSLDAETAIQQAYELGHGPWYTRGMDRLKLLEQEPEEKEILPKLSHPEKIRESLKSTGIEKVNTKQETGCELTDTALVIKKGKTGVKADMDQLEKQILEELKNHHYQTELDCPVIQQKPKKVDLQPYYDQVYQKMENAFLDKEQDYAMVPSRDGISFDVKKAEKQLEQAEEGTTVTVDFTVTKPEISTEDLETKLFRDVLGTYTTYGGGTSGRVRNIELSSRSCDGVILLPGETFSYNEIVGERTADRGYQSATVYANGEAVQGIGGGICQVSSTIFAASLYANLEIVERRNHSRTVAYLPSGMDATVSWGGPDYKFKNNTAYPVKLLVSYAGGVLQVQILGTKEDQNSVEVVTGRVDSYSVNTYRNHYDSQGNLLSTEEICHSRYKNPC